MIRFHGLNGAFTMAGRYAAEAAAKGDVCTQGKWTVIAGRIAMLIEAEQMLERDSAAPQAEMPPRKGAAAS